jgi:lauroyl/myristoyl acyltransferase
MADTRTSRLTDLIHVSSGDARWRRAAYVGARYGPVLWLRYSPPLFGLAFAAALPAARAAVRDNLRRVLGRRRAWLEHWDVARTFCGYAHCLAEALAAERPEAAAARYVLRGGHHLRSASADGRGFVVATAHVGAWDTAARLLARDLQREVIVVMAPEADEQARQLHDAVRTRRDVAVAHISHPLDALALVRHLRQGRVVAVQVDRVPPGGRRLEVPLFGRPFAMPQGPFQLAAVARCPMLPVFARRVDHFEYEVRVGHPISLPERPDHRQLEGAARCACLELERFLFAHPTHWFHFEPGGFS